MWAATGQVNYLLQQLEKSISNIGGTDISYSQWTGTQKLVARKTGRVNVISATYQQSPDCRETDMQDLEEKIWKKWKIKKDLSPDI